MGYQKKKKLGAILHSDGVEFRVWAPFAQEVSVASPYTYYDQGDKIPMTKETGGYWSVFVKDIQPGQSYKFFINTGTEILERNDPRGRALTASENGSSVVVANDYDWGDEGLMVIPVEQQIIYELHIGTFNRRDLSTQGTFYDAIEKLDYLADLGVNMIEVMPVTSMAYSNGWGYNPNSIFSIENSYGGRRGLMDFVKACHDRNIGVIIDVVYNHFFPDNELWRYDGWYENDRGGIYFYNDERGDTPWGSRPDFGRPEVRQFILDNIVMWFTEFRIDGIRLDSTAYMRNTNGAENDPAHDINDAWTLLHEIGSIAHKIQPHSLMIAEDTSGNSYITKSTHDGGCGLDTQWALTFPHAVRYALGLDTPYPADISQELERTYNGDVYQRVIFSDSHDTAANGHVRINEAVTPGKAASLEARQQTLIASAITLTAGGIPMLLQGQEFMQEGSFNDWNELEWEKADRYSGVVLAHKHLIALRKNTYSNTAGLLGQHTTIIHRNDPDRILAYHRWDKGGPKDDVVVIVNFGEKHFAEYDLTLPHKGIWQVRFNSSWHGYSDDFKDVKVQVIQADATGKITIPMAKRSVIIISQDE